MGFWDFIAPDLDEFRDVLRPVVPSQVIIPPFVFSQDEFIDLAWLNPGGGAGLAARVYYQASQLGIESPITEVLQQAINQQGTAGGTFSGAGFGGSFGWKSEANMPVIVIPNVYRVAIEGISGGQVITNVVGLRGSGTGLEASATAAVQTAWKVATGPLSQLTNLYALTGFRGMDLSSANGGITFIADTTVGGAGANAKATNGACALVKWNGGTRSRSSRGRLYFGPLSEGQVDSDGRSVLAAARTSLQTAFTAFRSSISASGFTLCVISPTTSSAFDVSSVAVESIIATQRRRIRS